jgi:Spy/CpxP family protein refolding chaperone
MTMGSATTGTRQIMKAECFKAKLNALFGQFRWRLLVVALMANATYAQHSTPYAGQEQRAIKALSDDEVKQYSSGAGMGHAKAAELNRYPGPMHVLELADQLELSSEQRTKTAQLMDAHKAHARELGAKVVAAERELDELFRSARATESEVAAKVRVAAAAQGEFRLSHLETHRRMRALLTDEQTARYDTLRGYTGTSVQNSHDAKH